MSKAAPKTPPGFQLIGRSRKAVLHAKMKATPAATPRRRRTFGKYSPLDKLPAKVQSELRKRSQRGEFLYQIRAWLLKEHSHSSSISAISCWCIRQEEIARKPHTAAAAFEFIVHAPGASEVRVLVKPL